MPQLNFTEPANPLVANLVSTSLTPQSEMAAVPVRQVPTDVFRVSFADVGAGVPSPDLKTLSAGAGQTVAQAGGNLVITTGTTTNEEVLLRTSRAFRGAMIARWQSTLSQRIANNNFEVALADLVGENLVYSNPSATSVVVTIPGNPFTSKNVGQGMNLGVITDTAAVPGRAVIASVSGNDVTFTVAGWPGVGGTGTLTLWGWHYIRALYDGTTATNMKFDSQRRGWNSGDTTLTTSTSAAPGHVGHIQSDGTKILASDALAASSTSAQFTSRGSRLANIPDDDIDLYLWIVARNGSTAPATTTTWTVGFISVEVIGNLKVQISGSVDAGAATGAVANSPMNLVQLGGNGVSTGNGTSGTGTLRVALVSDQTTNTNPLLVGGTGSTSIGKARDSVAGATDTMVPTAGIFRAIPTALASAAGDYDIPQVSGKGALWIAKQGALSTSHTISAASTNATTAKGSAGILHDISANNLNAAVRFLKIYDKSTAPTVGTDTPKRVIAIPAGASIQQVLDIECTAGISWALTTGIANSDTGAVAANEFAIGLSWF